MHSKWPSRFKDSSTLWHTGYFPIVINTWIVANDDIFHVILLKQCWPQNMLAPWYVGTKILSPWCWHSNPWSEGPQFLGNFQMHKKEFCKSWHRLQLSSWVKLTFGRGWFGTAVSGKHGWIFRLFTSIIECGMKLLIHSQTPTISLGTNR